MRKSSTVLLSILFLGLLATRPVAAQASKTDKLPEAPTAKTQNPAPTTASPFKDQKEKVSYAIGLNVAGSLRQMGLDVDPNILAQGVKDGVAGKPLMTDEEARGVLTQMQQEIRAKQDEKRKLEADKNKKEGEEFLVANKAKPGVVTLPSGLQYKILTPGTGPKPAATDKVVCNYRGTFINGNEFDSSYKRGEPATFPVNGVIRGWTEALQLMPVGSKWQLFVPSDLAYGERGTPDGTIAPSSTLVFEVELLSIQGAQTTAPAPAATPPKK